MDLGEVFDNASFVIEIYLEKVIDFKVKWNVSEFLSKFEVALALVVQGIKKNEFDKSEFEGALSILHEWGETLSMLVNDLTDMQFDYESDLDDVAESLEMVDDE